MKYNLSLSTKQKYIWFPVPKCATRSTEALLDKHTERTKLRSPYQEDWNNYFKFTIVRNPWDRLLSTWKNKCNYRNPIPSGPIAPTFRPGGRYYKMYTPYSKCFKSFIRALSTNPDSFYMPREGKIDRHVRMYSELLPFDNINYIGRFEYIQQDVDVICEKIGIPRQQLPHKNKSKHKHYTEYYDDETREIVAKLYAKDIEFLSYKFGE